jgi:thiosulfate reductase cytochrome b subunit
MRIFPCAKGNIGRIEHQSMTGSRLGVIRNANQGGHTRASSNDENSFPRSRWQVLSGRNAGSLSRGNRAKDLFRFSDNGSHRGTSRLCRMAAATDHRADSAGDVIYRHPIPVRIFHWVNALCFVLLLMSGLQIFNSYPHLYWGDVGYEGMTPVFEITGEASLTDRTSWVQIGRYRIPTTGVLGIPTNAPFIGVTNWAFPTWMTLPPGIFALGRGRGWHFLVFWIFAANLVWYLPYGLLTGRFRREFMPRRAELHPKAVRRQLSMHLRLRHTTGDEARHYNLLQKLSYVAVVFVLMPVQILSGITLSNTGLAIFPWLITLFDGRQSARTVHFVGAMLLLLFVLVHVFQMFVAGVVNELRSMITGYFVIPREKKS